jgi:hypothetical protein
MAITSWRPKGSCALEQKTRKHVCLSDEWARISVCTRDETEKGRDRGGQAGEDRQALGNRELAKRLHDLRPVAGRTDLFCVAALHRQ